MGVQDCARPGAFAFTVVSSLEKVFPDQAPPPAGAEPLRAFTGETVSFQVAWRPPAVRDLSDLPRLRLEVAAGRGARADVFRVGLVPVLVPAFEDSDDVFLRRAPGLFPDPLTPLGEGELSSSVLGAWSAWWVDVVVEDPEGDRHREVVVRVRTEDGQLLHVDTVALQLHRQVLPPVDIAVAQWLHTDCLADHYGVEPFGARHWELLESYLPSVGRAGGNCLLTPLWTPPLDTEVGGRRTTTQLLDVRRDETGWQFGFDRLDRWVALALRHGFDVLEMPHLFTQWGAEATPSIWAGGPAGLEEVFGWHVSASDPRYRGFLEALLPRLQAHLALRWPTVRTVWHVSDEPGHDKLAGYQAARAVVGDLVKGQTVIDALSDRSFLTSGAVDIPVVAADAAAPFISAGDEFWAYHCNVHDRGVSNRFIAMPSWRTRAIGEQLFRAGASGFLHWGFNFWNSQLSRGAVDPWQDPSAGNAFPAGDPFLVYPGPDGTPVESLRHRAFAQGMADHAALQLVRDLTGQDLTRTTPGTSRRQDALLSSGRTADDWLQTRPAVDAVLAGLT
ncbi:DUF4091 domain-containing protein [Kineococcus endophyticus]|uniref:DUF4091 domain-containing protein n=1 Tax=Kineococcus endophyticus TaxID=1181883 RepID=A0ABV3PA34_9ACTN